MPYAQSEVQREYDRLRYQRRKEADPFFWRRRDLQRGYDLRDARREADPVKYKILEMLASAKRRARKVGVPFSLRCEDIPNPTVCPVLGISLDWTSTRVSAASPTLDRLIPSVGYVPGNVHIISHRANTVKSDATAAELFAVAAWVKSHEDQE